MLDTKNYLYPQYKKRMKFASGLIRHLNACTDLLLCIQHNQNILILVGNDKKEEYPQGNKPQVVEEDQKNSASKMSDNESVRDKLVRHIS